MAEGQPPDENFTLWMTIAVLAMTALALLVILIFRLAIKRVMEEKEKMRKVEMEHQKKLLHNSINTQERERKRIAADLHDELSSWLNIIKLNIYEAGEHLPEWAEKTGKSLDEAIEISRNISHDLYPPMLADLGIVETLRDYLHPIRKQVNIELFFSGNSERLARNLELQLFRIFQEQLQNILKHARAGILEISLRISKHCCTFKMSDDGIGYDIKQVKNGLGLINIESRVQMLGGAYKIKTSPNEGTTLIIYIPL